MSAQFRQTLFNLYIGLGIFMLISGVSCYIQTESTTGDPIWNIRHVLPNLDLANNSVTDVKFNIGDNAFLPCRFPRYSRHHENGVSWIRRWDWQILSAGVFMYTNDDRFSVLHRDGSDDWTLQIKYVHLVDNGTYECQVHTGSGFLSHFVKLSVIQPRAVVLGPEELHVRTGNIFLITCVIEKILYPPVYIMWFHKNNSVNYDPRKERLRISVHLEGVHSTSTLTVIDTTYDDSGNYTCKSSNSEPASVRVYVTEGDTVAAVQRREMTNCGTNLDLWKYFWLWISSSFFLYSKILMLPT